MWTVVCVCARKQWTWPRKNILCSMLSTSKWGNMFALTLDGGQCMSTPPDVCNTPAPPSSPVPMPYVNIFDAKDVSPSTASKKVFICGAGALTVKSETTRSSGDEAGVNGGVVCGKNM